MSREILKVCETCEEPNDVRNMHRVTIERQVGSSTGTSGGSRRGNSHSISFGGSSSPRIGNRYSNTNTLHFNKRRSFKRESVWVCDGCHNPSGTVLSLGGRIKRWLILGLLILAAFAIFAGVGAVKNALSGIELPSLKSSTNSAHHAAATAADDEAATADPKASTPTRKMKFGERHEVVQPLPAERSKTYEKCSATVTDHCTE